MSFKYSSVQFGEILVAAKAIRSDLDSGNRTVEDIEVKYGRIKETYPEFFKVILGDRNSVHIISFMKNLVEFIESGEITKERADVELGQFMAGKYLPTDEELRRHIKLRDRKILHSYHYGSERGEAEARVIEQLPTKSWIKGVRFYCKQILKK